MREILFRGKTAKGEWCEGLPTRKHPFDKEVNRIQLLDDYLVNDFTEFFLAKNVIPETVGQYTGLTDKNGKKIFEGDIILFEDESPTNYEYHDCTEMRCGEIKFYDGEFYLTNRIAVEMSDLIYDGKLDGVIVGNIHDNPELLKGE